MLNFLKSLFRKKSIADSIADANKKNLSKTLTAFDLILLGIGCTIGTGIFVLTGIAAARYAGPAISLSYLFAAITCVFAALAYAELTAMVPVTGSAYSYTYVIFGEFVAWIVGWGLVLEYTIGASTVAAGWSGYMVGILKSGGINLPFALTTVPSSGGIIDLPAVCISSFIGFLLFCGTKKSVTLNRILVLVKFAVIFLFLVIAAPYIKTENWTRDFMPFGWHGVFVGAATIFFAYVGFDAVATAAEECKNPTRDIPIGLIGSLAACTVLYILVALFLTGIVDYKFLDSKEPLALALRLNGSNIGSALVGTGAVAGITSVLLVLMYGQSRIAFVMSRDGLIPACFNKLHPKNNTPYIGSIILSAVVAVLSGFVPIRTMSHMTSLGTLTAFVVVAFGVIVLRITKPDVHRPFKCPAVFVVAPMGVLSCGYLMYTLFAETGKPFVIWTAMGLCVYFFYGYRKSNLNKSKI